MRNYVKIQKDKTILVKTPIPYEITAYGDRANSLIVAVADNINDECIFLYDCLRLLGISKKEAIKNDYTLNSDTGEKLIRIASEKNISPELRKVIINHKW